MCISMCSMCLCGSKKINHIGTIETKESHSEERAKLRLNNIQSHLGVFTILEDSILMPQDYQQVNSLTILCDRPPAICVVAV